MLEGIFELTFQILKNTEVSFMNITQPVAGENLFTEEERNLIKKASKHLQGARLIAKTALEEMDKSKALQKCDTALEGLKKIPRKHFTLSEVYRISEWLKTAQFAAIDPEKAKAEISWRVEDTTYNGVKGKNIADEAYSSFKKNYNQMKKASEEKKLGYAIKCLNESATKMLPHQRLNIYKVIVEHNPDFNLKGYFRLKLLLLAEKTLKEMKPIAFQT